VKELPNSWFVCKLGEVLTIQNGYAFSSKDFKEKGVPLIRQSNLAGKCISLDKCVYLDPVFLETKKDFVLKKNDVLIGMSGSIGKLCIYNLDQPALQNQRTGRIKLLSKDIVDWRFIWEYLKTIESELKGKSKGLGINNVSSADIESLQFVIPPLSEQRRIVAKLEKILAKVDACKARLEKIPAFLKRFRQSVLAAACLGRLTADWREKNLQILPASNLIASLKTPAPENHFDVFRLSADYDLPPSWIWAPLGRLGKLDGGGTPSKSKASFWAGTIPWVSPKDMKTDRIVDSIDHISEEAISNSSAKMIPKGSILFVTRGMILNHTLPVSITDVQVTINQDMKALVPEIPDMREYLFLANKYLSAKMLFAVKEATHGTRRLESQVLKNWAIPVPPLEEQREIVRRVEALFKIADDIEKRYEKAKAQVDKLTQSILAKAFRGELVPQDPNDEPASELLKRIHAEREKKTAEGRKSGRIKTKFKAKRGRRRNLRLNSSV
jgi:type I restriction enzyme, S subunit